MFKRYQVFVEMGGRDWCPMVRFDELSQAGRWIEMYDPDGTVAMRVKDNEEGRFIELSEVFGPITKGVEDHKPTEWKKEGF